MKYLCRMFMAGVAIGVVLVMVDTRLDLEVLTNEVVHQRQQVEALTYQLASLEGETRYLATDVSLLTTQCEVTLDISISTARGGWWSRNAADRLRQLARLKRLREENKEWQRK